MQKSKTILGYAWAAAALVIALATFFGNDGFSRAIAGTGIAINPRYSGGEVMKTTDRDGYQIMVHRPVFAALIGQSKTGFVQVDFKPDSVASWFVVENGGEPGAKTAAIPRDLAKLLGRTIIDTILLRGGAATLVTIDPVKSLMTLAPPNPAKVEKSFIISRVDWKPDSLLMRAIIQTDALPEGKRIPYRSIYWAPDSCLPSTMVDTVDCNGGGPAFEVRLDTRAVTAAVAAFAPCVLGADQAYKLNHGWAVRVKLRNCR